MEIKPIVQFIDIATDSLLLGIGDVYKPDQSLNKENITSLSTKELEISSYALMNNYPNPFNAFTKIKYQLPEPCMLTISIFNTLGQKVKTLLNEKVQSGEYSISWDGTNEIGNYMSSGIYILKMKARSKDNSFSDSRKILMLK